MSQKNGALPTLTKRLHIHFLTTLFKNPNGFSFVLPFATFTYSDIIL